MASLIFFFFFQAEDGIRDGRETGVQTCALPISWPAGGEMKRELSIERCWSRVADTVRCDGRLGAGVWLTPTAYSTPRMSPAPRLGRGSSLIDRKSVV